MFLLKGNIYLWDVRHNFAMDIFFLCIQSWRLLFLNIFHFGILTHCLVLISTSWFTNNKIWRSEFRSLKGWQLWFLDASYLKLCASLNIHVKSFLCCLSYKNSDMLHDILQVYYRCKHFNENLFWYCILTSMQNSRILGITVIVRTNI